MNRGGLCDTCLAPGYCCREMRLSSTDGIFTSWASKDPAKALTERIGPHPFVPLNVTGTWKDDEGDEYRSHSWRCTALGADGRCTIYERRPQLCRDYREGSDPLCVHYVAVPDDEE